MKPTYEEIIQNILNYSPYKNHKYKPSIDELKNILSLIINNKYDNIEEICWKNFLLEFNKIFI